MIRLSHASYPRRLQVELSRGRGVVPFRVAVLSSSPVVRGPVVRSLRLFLLSQIVQPGAVVPEILALALVRERHGQECIDRIRVFHVEMRIVG